MTEDNNNIDAVAVVNDAFIKQVRSSTSKEDVGTLVSEMPKGLNVEPVEYPESRDLLVAKIRDLAMANAEIIGNIEIRKTQEGIMDGCDSMNATSRESNSKIKQRNSLLCRLEEWEYSGDPLTIHDDYFNQFCVDCSLKKYEDIIRLNKKLLHVVEKFNMIAADNDLVREILRHFLHNFVCILASLGEISILAFEVDNMSDDTEHSTRNFELDLNDYVSNSSKPKIILNASFSIEKHLEQESKESLDKERISTDYDFKKLTKNILTGQTKESSEKSADKNNIASISNDKDLHQNDLNKELDEERRSRKISIPNSSPLEQELSKEFLDEENRSETISIPNPSPSEYLFSAKTVPFFNNLKRIDNKTKLRKYGHNVWTLASISSKSGGQYLATDGDRTNNTISIWDMTSKTHIGSFKGHPAPIFGFTTATYHNGDQFLVSGSDDKTIKLWDINTKKNAGTIDVGFKVRSLCSFALEDVSSCIAIGFREVNIIQLWNIEAKEKLGILDGHFAAVYCLTSYTDADGRKCLASGSSDGIIKLWNLSTMACISTIDNGLSIRITALTTYVDSSGRFCLASGNNNGRVELWDLDKRSHL
eukprot:CAMPEP_0194267676 /NCGR_PEP_ID=MMETSP0169-20130528/2146_1 /TAXON_ID=218684 /ORGANISM="Corethron pennatum, Strain L29A3" /LENGTH=591 /DNA_ID=CAMNT_0039008613 /DNA_START=134 /DNA_END=1906 /DNA_ORIENTATION=-